RRLGLLLRLGEIVEAVFEPVLLQLQKAFPRRFPRDAQITGEREIRSELRRAGWPGDEQRPAEQERDRVHPMRHLFLLAGGSLSPARSFFSQAFWAARASLGKAAGAFFRVRP